LRTNPACPAALSAACLATSRAPVSLMTCPSAAVYSEVASTGLLLSVARTRPTASKRSKLKPSGLMVTWQDWQAGLAVSSVTFSRMVKDGSNLSSMNAIAMGGGLSMRPRMLRVTKTPRWIGEEDLV